MHIPYTTCLHIPLVHSCLYYYLLSLQYTALQIFFIAHFINLYLLFSFLNTYIYVYSLVFVLYIIALSMEQT